MHALLVQHEKSTTCLPQEIHSCISLLPLRTLATSLFLDYARFFFFLSLHPKSPSLGLRSTLVLK